MECLGIAIHQASFTGEFGIVYHALLTHESSIPQAVAVKTLTGLFICEIVCIFTIISISFIHRSIH